MFAIRSEVQIFTHNRNHKETKYMYSALFGEITANRVEKEIRIQWFGNYVESERQFCKIVINLRIVNTNLFLNFSNNFISILKLKSMDLNPRKLV